MINLLLIKKNLSSILKPLSKTTFLTKLKKNAKILDIGCGNNSGLRTKKILQFCEYTGIDIGEKFSTDYKNHSEKYIYTPSSEFCKTINDINQKYDAVISCHNLEHCEDRDGVLSAMCKKLAKNGFLYLSFPSIYSINFPSRRGTSLNYFDDNTHKNLPPDFSKVLEIIRDNNLIILKKSKTYKPILMNIYGNLIEPFSIIRKKTFQGTWEKWGFESIIIAQKIN